MIDLREASLDQFVRFVFDRPVEKPAWHEQIAFGEIEWDLGRNLELLTEMLLKAGEWLEPFNEEQLDQGFWFLCGPGLFSSEVLLAGACWNLEAPLEARLTLVGAIPGLYFRLFEKRDCSRMSIAWMMWDLIADAADLSGNSETDESLMEQLASIEGKDARMKFLELHGTDMSRLTLAAENDYAVIREGMLRSLSHMLHEGDEMTQQCALHGLNHLKHPHKLEVIERYLSEQADLSDQTIAFARICAKGEYM